MNNNKGMTEIEECVEKLRKGCKTLVEEFDHPEEWAKVFPPATDEEIEELEKSLKFPLPEDYKEFLKLANGAVIDYTIICGTDSIIVKDSWLPDGFYAISYSDRTSERLAISKEDGRVCLFWELQPEEWNFTLKLKNVLEECENDIYEYECKRKQQENAKKSPDEKKRDEEEVQAVVDKWRKFLEERKK